MLPTIKTYFVVLKVFVILVLRKLIRAEGGIRRIGKGYRQRVEFDESAEGETENFAAESKNFDFVDSEI